MVRPPTLTCVSTTEAQDSSLTRQFLLVQDLVATISLLTAAEEDYEIYMDLACRRISWAEDRYSHKTIHADILATFQDICWEENPVEFAFYFAAFSHIEGKFLKTSETLRTLLIQPLRPSRLNGSRGCRPHGPRL